ncbi:beta/gamma crystallin domain-containing protein [Psychromicrobium xiongbiense]|uniref:beta/gamma crystallin domain-containing protein n=1 Tax=Psychromicrobium xiongbiense TaxID=3051184 RepID=UPI002554FAB6|nr:beta/gamma crystallin domain-containing protein [Psychromicrobium sp. YIM S02556]
MKKRTRALSSVAVGLATLASASLLSIPSVSAINLVGCPAGNDFFQIYDSMNGTACFANAGAMHYVWYDLRRVESGNNDGWVDIQGTWYWNARQTTQYYGGGTLWTVSIL